MALLTKVLVAHNLHKYSLELEKAFEEGWRVNAGVAARRSLGNRFTVTLVKDSEAESVQTEEVTVDENTENTENTENKGVEDETKVENSVEQDNGAATETTSQEVDNSGTQTTDAENEAEVEVEADVEKPAKPLTKAQKAKLAKEAEENEGTAE